MFILDSSRLSFLVLYLEVSLLKYTKLYCNVTLNAGSKLGPALREQNRSKMCRELYWLPMPEENTVTQLHDNK